MTKTQKTGLMLFMAGLVMYWASPGIPLLGVVIILIGGTLFLQEWI